VQFSVPPCIDETLQSRCPMPTTTDMLDSVDSNLLNYTKPAVRHLGGEGVA